MNLTEAHKIATAATAALDATIGGAQLLLARKRQERDARMERYEQVVTIMEAESKAADAEIAALEVLIFGHRPSDRIELVPEGNTLLMKQELEAAE